MLITLGDTLKLASDMAQAVAGLRIKRGRVSTVTYSKDETPMEHDATVVELTEKIQTLNMRIRKCRELIAKCNLETELEYKIGDKPISLAEGLTLLGQLIYEQREVANLAQNEPMTRRHAPGSELVDYTILTYDPQIMHELKKEMGKHIRQLRAAIDRANITVEVELPDSYMDY